MSDNSAGNERAVYAQVCTAYNQIADFRAKLLTLLPIASAGGIFLLLSESLKPTYLRPIGAFGVLITLGLLLHELRGIQRCRFLVKSGEALERELGTPGLGIFGSVERARFPLGGAGVAALVIYPTVTGAWSYLISLPGPACLATVACLSAFGWAWRIAVVTALVAFVAVIVAEWDVRHTKVLSE